MIYLMGACVVGCIYWTWFKLLGSPVDDAIDDIIRNETLAEMDRNLRLYEEMKAARARDAAPRVLPD